MRRFSMRVATCVLAGACAAHVAGAPDAVPGPTLLDVDVVLEHGATPDTGYVAIYPSEKQRPCTCTGDGWPAMGSCIETSDAISCGCSPPPAACLTDVTLEQHASPVGSADLRQPFLGVLTIALPAPPLDGLELVLSGCGGAARVALPANAPPPPTITDLAFRAHEFDIAWSSALTSGAAVVGGIGGGFGGPECMGPFVSPTAVQSPELPFGDSAFLLPLASESTQETELGTFRVWNGAGQGARFFLPQDAGDGTYLVALGTGTGSGTASVTIDGTATQLDSFRPLGADLHAADVDSTVTLVVPAPLSPAGFAFHAGPAHDTLTVVDGGETFTATFPHVPPTSGLHPGLPTDGRYTITIGPVTATSTTTTATRTLSLAIDRTVPAFARPLP